MSLDEPMIDTWLAALPRPWTGSMNSILDIRRDKQKQLPSFRDLNPMRGLAPMEVVMGASTGGHARDHGRHGWIHRADHERDHGRVHKRRH